MVLAKNAREKIRVHVPNSGRIGVFFGELTVTHFLSFSTSISGGKMET